MEKFKTIAKYWDDSSETFDEHHATEDVSKWREQIKSIMQKSEGIMLDVGTGTGFVSIMSAECGFNSVGVDISAKMMEQGQKNAENRGCIVNFVKVCDNSLPFLDNSFDGVTNCRLLWTLLDPQESLKEWLRVLKPCGKLLNFTRTRETRPTAEQIEELEKMRDEMAKNATEEEKAKGHCHGSKIYENQVDNHLPLKYASDSEIVEELKKAGYINAKVIKMPKDVSLPREEEDSDEKNKLFGMNDWVCIYGEKPAN